MIYYDSNRTCFFIFMNKHSLCAASNVGHVFIIILPIGCCLKSFEAHHIWIMQHICPACDKTMIKWIFLIYFLINLPWSITTFFLSFLLVLSYKKKKALKTVQYKLNWQALCKNILFIEVEKKLKEFYTAAYYILYINCF